MWRWKKCLQENFHTLFARDFEFSSRFFPHYQHYTTATITNVLSLSLSIRLAYGHKSPNENREPLRDAFLFLLDSLAALYRLHACFGLMED